MAVGLHIRCTSREPLGFLNERTKMKKELTQRGFTIYKFKDSNGEDCSLQKSSVATEDLIWLGQGESRMHLTQEQASMLIVKLAEFVETGDL